MRLLKGLFTPPPFGVEGFAAGAILAVIVGMGSFLMLSMLSSCEDDQKPAHQKVVASPAPSALSRVGSDIIPSEENELNKCRRVDKWKDFSNNVTCYITYDYCSHSQLAISCLKVE